MRNVYSAFALVLMLTVTAVGSTSCATNTKPDVAVAAYTTDLVKAATELQRGVTQLTEAKLLPVATAQTVTDQIEIFGQKGDEVSVALKAYHAATTPLEKQSKAALVQALITQLNGPLAKILGITFPEGTVQRITKLVGTTMSVVSAVQAEVAKGLGS